MSVARVAVLHLGREHSLGEHRRVASWCRLVREMGGEVTTIALSHEHPARWGDALVRAPAALVGTAAYETLAWSPLGVRRRLLGLRPTAVVCVTARAYHPHLDDVAPRLVLDYVDALSRSYRDRARLVRHPLRRIGYRTLSRRHRRVERRPPPAATVRVAAGYTDAERLGCHWVPILAETSRPSLDTDSATHIGFVGSLRYPPNVAALERLARMWPDIHRRRPWATVLVAGASPTAGVRRLCALHSWQVHADFADLGEVLRRCQVTVSPLDYTAGLQIKVLDAAAFGIAQVVTPQALEGFAPTFPVTVATTDAEFVESLVALLDDPDRRRREGDTARRHVLEHYGPSAWVDTVRRLLAVA